MANNKTGGTGGISFGSLFQVTFIVLKLCGVIEWSWLWVLVPTWIAILLYVIAVIVYVKWR